jgi:ribosomal protein L29
MTVPATMTLAELQKLIADSRGEWEHLEFKKTTGEMLGEVKAICGSEEDK